MLNPKKLIRHKFCFNLSRYISFNKKLAVTQ